MRRIQVFNSVTLDGYFTGPKGELDWAYEGGDDPEFAAFISGNASGNGTLLLGRVTYEMMRAFWPTDAAKQTMPEVAAGMNRMEKIVLSRSLSGSDWNNTRILNDDPIEQIRQLKSGEGPGMTVLGSGSVVRQLVEAGLVDAMQLVICPIALGAGRTMFDGVPDAQRFRLTDSRSFSNGKVVVSYEAR